MAADQRTDYWASADSRGEPSELATRYPWATDPLGTRNENCHRGWFRRIHTRAEVRVVVGLASYRVQPDKLATFFDAEWTVAPDSNRVGYRYSGVSVDWGLSAVERGGLLNQGAASAGSPSAA